MTPFPLGTGQAPLKDLTSSLEGEPDATRYSSLDSRDDYSDSARPGPPKTYYYSCHPGAGTAAIHSHTPHKHRIFMPGILFHYAEYRHNAFYTILLRFLLSPKKGSLASLFKLLRSLTTRQAFYQSPLPSHLSTHISLLAENLASCLA